jgi:CRP-like cAMP-binding protein
MTTERLECEHIFDFLRPEQVNVLSKTAQVRKLKAGEDVYHRGDKAQNFYVVLHGGVALRLPARSGMSIPIDELSEGAIFGTSVSLAFNTYLCTAQCVKDSELLVIHTGALKKLLEEDAVMGYAIQSRISRCYFIRYINTMQRLQTILMTLPLEIET